jgi:parvulin-like peptidyl-prolyl isomerase
MLRKALAASALSLAFLASAPEAHADNAVLIDKIVAVVGEVSILRSDVLAAARPFYAKIGKPEEHMKEVEQLHQDILGRMIEDVLVAREARRLNLDVRPGDIEQAKEWIAKQNKLTKEQLEAEVKKQGVGKDEYEAELHRQLLAEKWVALKVRPRVKMAPPTSEKPEDQAPFLKALEDERRKAVAELRQTAYVEVRW